MSKTATAVYCAILFCCLFLLFPIDGLAQDSYSAERQRAFQLYEQNNFVDAIPFFEKLVSTKNDDIAVLERLGWSLFVVSGSVKDAQRQKVMRDRASEVLMRAKKLGDDSELLKVALEGLSSANTETEEFRYSANSKANEAMTEGESAHSRGELDKAIKCYEEALRLDPKLYLAALWAGDMYFKKGYQATDRSVKKQLMTTAGEWFTRAIKIDENIETAYRYWGDALMAIEDKDGAKEKFIDAILAEPYDNKPYVGLSEWAKRFKVPLGHPEIKLPAAANASLPSKSPTEINSEPEVLDSNRVADYYWSFYYLARANYKTSSFQKEHPHETQYRHSLQEEASALRAVAEVVSKDVTTGKRDAVDPSLKNLLHLYKADMIEPYVLFTRPDAGIAEDYVTYRNSNREKLRRYWLDFVVGTDAEALR